MLTHVPLCMCCEGVMSMCDDARKRKQRNHASECHVSARRATSCSWVPKAGCSNEDTNCLPIKRKLC